MSAIHQDEEGQWWFWDETWTEPVGPYPTRDVAEQRLAEYCHWLETGELPTDLAHGGPTA